MTDLQRQWLTLAAVVLSLLVVASGVGVALRRRYGPGSAGVANYNARVRAWWVMAAVFGGAAWLGFVTTTLLFAVLSFLALREFVTLTPTRRGDHHTLFWVFFVLVPVQYGLLYARWVPMFMILIPVYGFLFLSFRSALSGDCTRYLERVAKVYWAAMICVYTLSHAPALLLLNIPGFEGRAAFLLIYLVMIVQLDDVLQYCWGKLLGKHKLAPSVSPSKTWEGLVGGVTSAALVAVLLTPMTPFAWWQSGLLGLLIALAGTAGGIVMSAIKRDAGVKDYGFLIQGHGGVMDRLDSLTFAAPLFFHVVRYCFAAH